MLLWATSDSLLHLGLSVLYHLTACPDAPLQNENPQHPSLLLWRRRTGKRWGKVYRAPMLLDLFFHSLCSSSPECSSPAQELFSGTLNKCQVCWGKMYTAAWPHREFKHCFPVCQTWWMRGLGAASLHDRSTHFILPHTVELPKHPHTPHLYQAQSGTVDQHQGNLTAFSQRTGEGIKKKKLLLIFILNLSSWTTKSMLTSGFNSYVAFISNFLYVLNWRWCVLMRKLPGRYTMLNITINC